MDMLTMSALQWHLEALFPYSTHLGVAKFVLSAQLNPEKGFIIKKYNDFPKKNIVSISKE